VLGAVGIGAMIGAPVAEAIYASGVASFEGGEASMKESGQALNMVRALGAGSSGADFRAGNDAIRAQEDKVRELQKPDMFADFMGLFGASNRDVELKSQEGMLQEMREAYSKGAEAAQKQSEAAVAITVAAEKLGGSQLNRGNTPAPPVP